MTANTVPIDLDQLRTAMTTVLAHIESTSGPVVELPVDLFWSVPPGEAFDMSMKPAELTVGQVSDSWEFLARERLADDGSTIGYSAVWLADVLAAIGHNHVG